MLIDIVFAIFIGYGFYVGYSRGIIETVFKVLSYIFGLVAALKFSTPMTKLLEDTFDTTNPFMFILGFLVSFLIAMMLLRFVSGLFTSVLEKANINFINQAAGGMLSAAFAVLVYSLVIWFANASHLLDEGAKRQSFTYEYIQDYPNYVWSVAGKLKVPILEFWDGSMQFMDKVEEMSLEKQESDSNIFDIEEKSYE